MFAHSFKNTLKILLRQKTLVFWSLLFPLALGLMFKLALGNIDNEIKLDAIPVAVHQELVEEPFFKMFLDQLEKEEIFEVHQVSDDQLLKDKEVVAYIETTDKLVTNESGLKQTIVESIMNSYAHNQASIMRILQDNPQADLSQFWAQSDHIKDTSSENMNMVNTYFYTLVGMQTMYGYMWGLSVIYQYEANLSTTAKRNSIAPIKKFVSLFASLLVAWLINMAVVIVTMFFVHFVLGIELGHRIGYIFALVSLGALTGVAYGTLIGVSNKKSIDFKVGIGVSSTMALSFLAGMMVSDIKVLIQRTVPIINQLNPVALITDAMYSLYYYEGLGRFFMNMMWLGGVTLFLIALTFFLIRGKQYDSL